MRAVLPSDPVVAHLHGEHQEFFLVFINHEPVGRVDLLHELVRFLEDERLRARYLDLRNLNCCVVTLEYLTDDLARFLVITTARAASFGCSRPQQHVLSFPSEIVSCARHATIVPIVCCALEHWRALLRKSGRLFSCLLVLLMPRVGLLSTVVTPHSVTERTLERTAIRLLLATMILWDSGS